MAKTFEALLKAEKEGQRRQEEAVGFEPRVLPTYYKPIRFKFSSQIEEEFHRLKYNILHTTSGNKIKTLLFLSSNKGEGNSTVLIKFAISLASDGERVLIVDANLRAPSFHQRFNLEKEKGLTELFLGKYILREVIKKTQVNHLSIITSGNPHPDPFSIFESASLNSYIEEMKTQTDWVLFDSPPINSYNDAVALAVKMDGVIMVIEAEKTRWETAQEAKKRVENGNKNIIGVVLNKRRFYVPKWLYKTL